MSNILQSLGISLLSLFLVACTDKSKFYGNMNTDQKTVYMDKLINKLNKSPAQMGSTKQLFIGDSEQGLVIAMGTYPKVASPQQIKKASYVIAKQDIDDPFCYRQLTTSFTDFGISFQSIMKDLEGTVVYESELCEGAKFAPRPYQEMSEEQKSITLDNISKRFNAYAKGENLDSNVLYTTKYHADSAQEIIFASREYKGTFTEKNFAFVQEQLTKPSLPSICDIKYIRDLSKDGVTLQMSITDKSGKPLVPTIICGSNINVKATPKLRGLSASL